jgi:uncharacterized protein
VHLPITDVEVRILGALMEKGITTPENYPLTLNALLAACNQTTNRDPVMQFDEDAAIHWIIALRRGGLLRQIQPVGSRVTKYEHLLGDEPDLDGPAIAVLCVLMLRGPQTTGELMARTARLASFDDVPHVEQVLERLMARGQPLVERLPRRPGQKEVRFGHTMSGEAAQADAPATPGATADEPPRPTRRAAPVEDDRVAALERSVGTLQAEVGALRAEVDALRSRIQ